DVGGVHLVLVTLLGEVSGALLAPRQHACATNLFSDKASDIPRPTSLVLRRVFTSWSQNCRSATASLSIASSPSTARKSSSQGKASSVGFRANPGATKSVRASGWRGLNLGTL